MDDDIGLMEYREASRRDKARFYSPVLNRFIQPDSIVPNPANPQAWNRFSYVINSPINLTDPSGHCYYNGTWIPNGQDGTCSWQSESNDNGGSGGSSSGSSGNNDDEIIDEEEEQEYHGQGTFEIFPSIPYTIYGQEYEIGCVDKILNNDGSWRGTYCTTFDGYYLYEHRDELQFELSKIENMPYTNEDFQEDLIKHLFERGFSQIDPLGFWDDVAFFLDASNKNAENQISEVDFIFDKALIVHAGNTATGVEVMIWSNIRDANGNSVSVISISNGGQAFAVEVGNAAVSPFREILNNLTP